MLNATISPAVSPKRDGSLPAPDVRRAQRGRYLASRRVRIIEQDDLVIVEFVDQKPWYTATPPRARPSIALLGSSGAFVVLLAARLLHLV